MIGGHAISCFMMRQMETTPTATKSRSPAARRSFARWSACASSGWARSSLTTTCVKALGRGRCRRIGRRSWSSAAGRCRKNCWRISEASEDGKTGVFDTHPCDADRVRAAEAAAAEGVLVGADSRASQLFRDFDALSAAATRHHFEHDLGISLDDVTLVDTAVALRESENRRENFSASERFFGDGASLYRPLRLHVSEADALENGALLARLAAARDAMANAADPASRYGEFNQPSSKRQKAFAARALLAGFASVSAEDFELAAVLRTPPPRRRTRPAIGSGRCVGPGGVRGGGRRPVVVCVGLAAQLHGSVGRVSERDAFTGRSAQRSWGGDSGVHELRRLDIASQLVEANAESSPNGERAAAYARQLDRRFIDCRETVRRGLAAVACPARFTASPMTVAERCGMPPVAALRDRVGDSGPGAVPILRHPWPAGRGRPAGRGLPCRRDSESPRTRRLLTPHRPNRPRTFVTAIAML